MDNNKNRKRDGSFIVRVSKEEREKIQAKVDEAGYRSTSAFVRDFIANAEPKPKTHISMDIFAFQRELMNFASMINAQKPKDELIRQIKVISAISLGGAR